MSPRTGTAAWALLASTLVADVGMAGEAYPDLAWSRDVPVLAVGVGALIAGHLVNSDVRVVPPEGLDLSSIPLGLDRNIVGNHDTGDNIASDRVRNVAVAFPILVGFATSSGDDRLHETARRAIVYGEAFVLGQGLVRLGKSAFSRARPFAYLPEEDRPDDSEYDVRREHAFGAMPSGHSATAWTAAALGITEHLLNCPRASAVERFSLSFLGGALAGATSTLRVEAGQHFPSDVAVGAVIGVGIGVSLPLLHRDGRRTPSRRAWLTAGAGTLAGALVGAVVSAVD